VGGRHGQHTVFRAVQGPLGVTDRSVLMQRIMSFSNPLYFCLNVMVGGWNLFKTVRELLRVATFTLFKLRTLHLTAVPVGLRRFRNSLFPLGVACNPFPRTFDVRTDALWIRVTASCVLGRPARCDKYWVLDWVNPSVRTVEALRHGPKRRLECKV
jgi:hypothetical protein